jgi:hypothetical protein
VCALLQFADVEPDSTGNDMEIQYLIKTDEQRAIVRAVKIPAKYISTFDEKK